MEGTTLWFSCALGLATAVLYLALGARESQRASARGDVALGWYSVFWVAFGAHLLFESLWTLGMLVAPPPLALSVAVLQLRVGTAIVAFFALVYYLLVLYTGRRGVLVPLGVAYSGIFVFVSYHFAARDPIGHETRAWAADLTYANDGAATWPFVVGLLFGPPLLASVAYAFLLRFTSEPKLRRRILVTSITFAVLFGSFILGFLHEAWYWWGLVGRLVLLGAVASLLVNAMETPIVAPRGSGLPTVGR